MQAAALCTHHVSIYKATLHDWSWATANGPQLQFLCPPESRLLMRDRLKWVFLCKCTKQVTCQDSDKPSFWWPFSQFWNREIIEHFGLNGSILRRSWRWGKKKSTHESNRGYGVERSNWCLTVKLQTDVFFPEFFSDRMPPAVGVNVVL